MTTSFRAALVAALLAAVPALGAEPAQPYATSSDPAVAARQQAAHDVVHRYEMLLNAGDTAAILDLFAPDSVAEWNNVPTAATTEQRRAIYGALFKTAKFSTVFGTVWPLASRLIVPAEVLRRKAQSGATCRISATVKRMSSAMACAMPTYAARTASMPTLGGLFCGMSTASGV